MLESTDLDSALERLTSDAGRTLPTFIMAGAGASQADSFSRGLQLPLAASLRDQLLIAKYGNDPETNLKRFEKEFNLSSPTPDQVWQALMRSADKQESYANQLYEAFSPDKPIPPAYHMLARWFHSNPKRVGGVATTNFDYQFGKAFHNVAISLNRRHCIDYNIAELPEDFRFFSRTKKELSSIVQRLHGSLDKPWSIVAGSKESLYDISHALLEGTQDNAKAHPFKILRKVLDALDENVQKELSFPPYLFLQECIRKTGRIIFLGYSFQDVDLVATLRTCCSHIQEFIVIDQYANSDLRNRIKDFPNVMLVQSTAERFLEGFIREREPSKACIKLPLRERDILRSGPKYIHNYPHKRITRHVSKDEFIRFIDPIYGEVQFDESIQNDLMQIIDTGEVQRLRQIKQLSFAHFKFHGATHDRFSHSLGVAYLSDLIMKRWIHNWENRVPRKLEKDDHLAFTGSCLIHDIGHGPFGHTMDLVRTKLREEHGHEDDTLSIFQQIFGQDCFADLDLALNNIPINRNKMKAILPSIHGDTNGCENELAWLSLVLSNNGCDVDRLDFVMRDAACTLTSLGNSKGKARDALEKLISNYEQILRGIYLVKQESGYIIAHGEECRDTLEAFAFLYKELYEKVYYCWQNVSGRVMLADAATEMIRSRKLEFSDIKPLTDVELLATLEEFENPKVSEMAYLVKYRRLFDLVCDREVTTDEFKSAIQMPDREVVENLLKVHWNDAMLVARLPAKEVFINFAKFEAKSSAIIEKENNYGEMVGMSIFPELLSSTPARIMVFQPPS